MIDQEIQRKIEDFRKLGLPKYVPRDGIIHFGDRMVSTIIGGRRCGKSFRALQEADEFIRKKAVESPNHVCNIDFDNPIIAGMSSKELNLIEKTFLKISPDCDLNTPLLFILDEIHKISDWELYVIDLSRNPKWKVIVTGSSSKLLREEISTELRGKAISSVVYPLSFREFLRFKSFEYDGSTKGSADVLRYFDEYMKWGGFPAVANIDEFSRNTLLREYFDTMILKDVIQRYSVSKPRQCIQLYNFLMSNIGRPHTLQSAYDYLKEGDFATSRESVSDYLKWGEDSWFFFCVPIFSKSHKDQERNYKKIYAIDWALALQNSSVWDGSFSRAFENMIYIHLKRRFPHVYYYLTRSKRQEVDFVVLDHHGNHLFAIQACMDIADKSTLKREIEALVATAKYFKIKENLIITLNQENIYDEEGVKIKAVPAWKWLLAEDE